MYNPDHRAAPADLAVHPYLCFVEETEAARYAGGSRNPVGEMMEASSSSSTTMAAPVAGASSGSSKDAAATANGGD